MHAGIKISIKRMLKALNDIKEVVNIYANKGQGKNKKQRQQQTVLTKLSELQSCLLDALHIERAKKRKNDRLG